MRPKDMDDAADKQQAKARRQLNEIVSDVETRHGVEHQNPDEIEEDYSKAYGEESGTLDSG